MRSVNSAVTRRRESTGGFSLAVLLQQHRTQQKPYRHDAESKYKDHKNEVIVPHALTIGAPYNLGLPAAVSIAEFLAAASIRSRRTRLSVVDFLGKLAHHYCEQFYPNPYLDVAGIYPAKPLISLALPSGIEPLSPP